MTGNLKSARWQQIRVINLALFTVLYILRRPADALYPSVWSEDGVINIPQAIEHGWSSLLIPVSGYLLIPSKVVTLLSLSISGLFYPEVAYVLTLICTILVITILTSSLIELPKKEYLPIIIALLPYGPEVFSTPLYVFWWTSLLLLVPLFYSTNSDKKTFPWINIGSTIIACLSSPLSILLMPAMMLKTYITRSRLSYIVLAIWTALSAIQMYFSLNQVSGERDFSNLHMVLPKFLGSYIIYDRFFITPNPASYILSVVFLLAGCLALYFTLIVKRQEFFNTSAAFLAVLSTMLASWLRISILEIDPILGGSRYFFFPYVFISIFLITSYSIPSRSISPVPKRFLTTICTFVLVASCTATWIQDPSNFYRIHHPLNWRHELYNCLASSDTYSLKIHTSGDRGHLWNREYSREECLKIAQSGILANWYGLDKNWLQRFKESPDIEL
jgi:hypothetical protein